jgi:hypothetical protein
MTLPTTKTNPTSNFASVSILMHGRPKIGKSTWCSRAEGAIFLATEPGLRSLDVYQQPITDWTGMLDACKEIAAGKHQFKTVIIDTIDNAYLYCRTAMCEQLGIKDPADAGYGKGFAAVNNEFRRVLTKLASLPYGLYMISHSREAEVETRTGKQSRWVPTLPEKAREIVDGMVEIILFADIDSHQDADNVEQTTRVLRTKPSHKWEAGDRTNRLPPTIPLAYAEFVKAWEAGAPKK